MKDKLKQKLLDDFEEIQDKAETNNIGLNEERLEVREEISDYVIKFIEN